MTEDNGIETFAIITKEMQLTLGTFITEVDLKHALLETDLLNPIIYKGQSASVSKRLNQAGICYARKQSKQREITLFHCYCSQTISKELIIIYSVLKCSDLHAVYTGMIHLVSFEQLIVHFRIFDLRINNLHEL